MSTREKLYSLIEGLTEEQLNEFVVIFTEIAQKKKEKYNDVESVKGILHEYANPNLIPLEEGAWAEAAAENEMKFWEDYRNENA